MECNCRYHNYRQCLLPINCKNVLSILMLLPRYFCRSQWPRGLRRRSSAARLLRLWVRIPPGTWMFVVSVVCCQVEVSATSWSLVQRSPTDVVRRFVCSRNLKHEEALTQWGLSHQNQPNKQTEIITEVCLSKERKIKAATTEVYHWWQWASHIKYKQQAFLRSTSILYSNFFLHH